MKSSDAIPALNTGDTLKGECSLSSTQKGYQGAITLQT